jgi:hypothetical protein
MFGRSHIAVFILAIGLGACVPAVGPDQVAVRFYPPPWKNPLVQQYEEAACTRTANTYVRAYVECMQRLGYRPEIIGQGGVHMSVSQLPSPPRPPTPSPYEEPPSIIPHPLEAPEAPQPSTSTLANIGSGVARFRKYQPEIFKAAHPSGKLINGSVRDLQTGSGEAIVADDISWQGTFSG